VSIATPTITHQEIAEEFLAERVHVLVEKPIGSSVPGGTAMVAAARRFDRVLAVGHIERCNPAFVQARTMLTGPRFMESHRLAPFVPRSLDVDVILDLMIHDLDLVLSLARTAVEGVEAIGVPVITDEADIANARIRFQDGSVANLTASRVSRTRMRKIRFFERNLYLSVDLAAKQLESVQLSHSPEPIAIPVDAPADAQMLARKGLLLRHAATQVDGDALETEIRCFLESCIGRGAPAVDGEAGLACLRLAVAVRDAVAASMRRLGGGAGGP
jgi:predicted dehydrogenase